LGSIIGKIGKGEELKVFHNNWRQKGGGATGRLPKRTKNEGKQAGAKLLLNLS